MRALPASAITHELQPVQPVDVPVQVSASLARLDMETLRLIVNWQDPGQRITWQQDTGELIRRDFLWEKSCVELLVGAQGHSSYVEWHFCPHGYWNAYWFGRHHPVDGALPQRLITSSPLIEHSGQHLSVLIPLPVWQHYQLLNASLGVNLLIDQQTVQWNLPGQHHQVGAHIPDEWTIRL